MSPKRLSRLGFTLIELLVVIAIIAILIALLVPAVQKVREAAARSQCQNNLKQVALACHAYHDANKLWPRTSNMKNELSWHVYILPYIEQKPLYDQFDLTETGDYQSANRIQYGLTPISTYLCPSSLTTRMVNFAPHIINSPDLINGAPAYTTHYYGVMGPEGTNGYTGQAYAVKDNGGSHGGRSTHGVFQREKDIRLKDIIDGTSNTLAVGEMSWYNDITGTRYRPWLRGCLKTATPTTAADIWCAGAKNVTVAINVPGAAVFNEMAFGSQHPSGTNFSFADGSTTFLYQDITMKVYLALASRNGEEPATLP